MTWTDLPEFTAPQFDRTAVKAIHRAWQTRLETSRDEATYADLYRTHLTLLRAALDPQPNGLFARLTGRNAAPDLQHLYRWTQAFASDRFLPRTPGRPAMQQQLVALWDDYLALLDRLLDQPDQPVTDSPLPRDKGRWGDIAAGALLAIRSHSDFGPQGRRLREDAAQRVPTLLMRFPYLGDPLIMGLLGDHPDLVEPAVDVLAHRLSQDVDLEEDGVLLDAGLEMTGFHANRDDPFRKVGPQIVKQLLAKANEWPDTRLRLMVEALALIPLNIKIGDQAAEIARVVTGIAQEENRIAEGPGDVPVGLSAERLTQMARKRLKAKRAELTLLQTDFSTHREERLAAAAAHLRTAKTAAKVAQALAKALPSEITAPLPEVLARLSAPATPKHFPMPRADGPAFADFGFKLLVIEELMYVQHQLSPAFDLRAFAKEWEAREISVENDGYAPIPEARAWFDALPIPPEALARVQCLEQSWGLDGGPRFMRHLYPFWDPGAGDGAIPVTDAAVADLARLPNLRSISGLERNTPVPDGLLDAMAARGIEAIPEDWAAFGPK